MSLSVASYFPFNATCYLKGHFYVAQELRREGVLFRKAEVNPPGRGRSGGRLCGGSGVCSKRRTVILLTPRSLAMLRNVAPAACRSRTVCHRAMRLDLASGSRSFAPLGLGGTLESDIRPRSRTVCRGPTMRSSWSTIRSVGSALLYRNKKENATVYGWLDRFAVQWRGPGATELPVEVKFARLSSLRTRNQSSTKRRQT
jgi:hypothetical protein